MNTQTDIDIAWDLSVQIDNHDVDIVMLNDNITPIEYVIFILINIFEFDEMKACKTAVLIDRNGEGIVFSGSKDEADYLLNELNENNDAFGFELKAIIKEKE